MTDPPELAGEPLSQRFKTTTIAHADHDFLSPLSLAKADWLIRLLDLPQGARVLDIACGKAGFLRRLLRARPDAGGVGIDINPAFLAAAAEAGGADGLARRLSLIERSAAEWLPEAPRFDAVLCFGGSQALGGFDGLVQAAPQLLSPGGLLLVGDGFWQKAPDPDYLAVLGATPDELTDHAGNAARLRRAGFRILATAAASPDEWDEYEGLYCRARTRWALAHPEDPDAARLLAETERWHDAYLRWGRATLGFGWYLALLP